MHRMGDCKTSIHFTFQYVSINTVEDVAVLILNKTLHSNMFLLIRQTACLVLEVNHFTFQYVSINTTG